jgi:putative ABC transport system substrate-binding protein
MAIIVILTFGFLVAPLATEAQPPSTVARVGFLVAASFSSPRARATFTAFEQGLRDLGYVEGQNLVIEFRNAEGNVERLPALAAELVQRHVDVLVVAGPEVVLRAGRQATSTIPIVMVAVEYDPMALGYIAGLPRPGGQITGLVSQQIEITDKCLELLKDALPHVARVAVLWDATSADQFRAAEGTARVLGIQLQSLELRDPPAYDYDSALAAAAREGAEALLVLRSPLFSRGRDRLVALAMQHRLPIVTGVLVLAEAGGLMAYGADPVDMSRRAATYVDKILKGAKPADLPVEQPMKYELVINLKAAKALGLTMPPHLLVLADEVIQ